MTLMSGLGSRIFAAGFVVALLLYLTYSRTPTSTGSSYTSPSKSYTPHVKSSSRLSSALASDASLKDISNSTLGFEKIFVVSLPSRSDHRDSMSLAAHFTGMQLEYVDGVTEIDQEKILPPYPPEKEFKPGEVKAWRAHMNIFRRMVEENITTALIMEDDIDWDIRIKQQLQEFALASRFLVQPKRGSKNELWDPTNPRTSLDESPIDFVPDHPTAAPTTSPYGDTDRWDVLWLGHCGMKMPESSDLHMPLGRAVIENDETVPEPQHFRPEWGSSELTERYDPHTRVVHVPKEAVCTLAYAITLSAARNFLYDFGVRFIDNPLDLLIRNICQGTNGRELRPCLTVTPQLFQAHRAAGSLSKGSDINKGQEGENAFAFTPNIKWGTKVNFPKLIKGETDYIDHYPDGEETPEWNH